MGSGRITGPLSVLILSVAVIGAFMGGVMSPALVAFAADRGGPTLPAESRLTVPDPSADTASTRFPLAYRPSALTGVATLKDNRPSPSDADRGHVSYTKGPPEASWGVTSESTVEWRLSSEWNETISSTCESLSVGDADLDGVREAIVYLNNGSVIVLKWLNPGFLSIYQNQVGNIAQGSGIGDVDADGLPEFVAGAQIDSEVELVRVYGFNETSGSFNVEWEGNFSSATSPHDIRLGDVDGDGSLEVVLSDYYAVRILDYNASSHSFNEVWNHTGGINYWMCLGDVDGDGVDEIVATQNGGAFYLFNHNASTSTYDTWVGYDYELGVMPWGVEAGDFGGDGRDEILVGNENGTVRVMSWDGASFAEQWGTSVGENAYGLACGDLDSDSVEEFVVGSAINDSMPMIIIDYLNASYVSVSTSQNGVDVATLADVDLDGETELITSWGEIIRLYSLQEIIHTGDLVIAGDQTYFVRNVVFVQVGNILVQENATLVLDDAELVLNQTVSHQYSLTVQGNGRVISTYANISGDHFDQSFMDQSVADFTNTTWKQFTWTYVYGKSMILMNSTGLGHVFVGTSMCVYNSSVNGYVLTGSTAELLIVGSQVGGACISCDNSEVTVEGVETLNYSAFEPYVWVFNTFSNLTVTGGCVTNLTVLDSEVWLCFEPQNSNFTVLDSEIGWIEAYNSRVVVNGSWTGSISGTMSLGISDSTVWGVGGWEAADVSICRSTVSLIWLWDQLTILVQDSTVWELRSWGFIGNLPLLNVTDMWRLEIYDSEFAIYGDIKFSSQPSVTLQNSTVRRTFEVEALSDDPMPDVNVTLYALDGSVVWSNVTDSEGKTGFNLTFTEVNYTMHLRLEATKEWYYTVLRDVSLVADTPVVCIMNIIPEHDIGILELEAPYYLMPGRTTRINATVCNLGLNNESDITVSLIVDDVTADSTVVPFLVNMTSTQVTFKWPAPQALEDYNITVFAAPVAGEDDLGDNGMTRFIRVTNPLIRPVPGQCANYTVSSNTTATQDWLEVRYGAYLNWCYVSVTWSQSYGGTSTPLNIVTRYTEYWSGGDYFIFPWIFQMETNITLGSKVDMFSTNATVVGSDVVEYEGQSVDCWIVQEYPYGGHNYTYWFDKGSGLMMAVVAVQPGSETSFVLNATNIRVGFEAGARLSVEGHTSWYWVENTGVNSTAVGDVDSDGAAEMVTGGYFYDGGRYQAQLAVWNGSAFTVEGLKTWYWTGNTWIDSVAVGDVDGDGAPEIITGGRYHDGVRYCAQLIVWDGSTLAVEQIRTWYWYSDTGINSVAVGDVDGDGYAEIVTGGTYYDGIRIVAQLVVWNGSDLTVEGLRTWYWNGDTSIASLAVGDVDEDDSVELVTGGRYDDGARNVAQLVVWNGSDLTVEGVRTWYWYGDTGINSLVVGDVDLDYEVEIVTGGYFSDGIRLNAQLVVWNGSDLAVEGVRTWYWVYDTSISSVAIGDVDGDTFPEIVTGGRYNDGYENAQLVVWDGFTLDVRQVRTWRWFNETYLDSVSAYDTDSDSMAEIIAGGRYHDGTRDCAQITIWEVQ